METLNFAFAFSAGVLATFNPCAWAMLPTFVSFYLGSREADYEQRSFAARAAEGLTLGLLVTGGFLLVFSIVAVILSIGLKVYCALSAFRVIDHRHCVDYSRFMAFGWQTISVLPVPASNQPIPHKESKISVHVWGWLRIGFIKLYFTCIHIHCWRKSYSFWLSFRCNYVQWICFGHRSYPDGRCAWYGVAKRRNCPVVSQIPSTCISP